MKRIIKLSDMRPIGSLEELLTTFEQEVIKCEKAGYTKRVGELMRHLVEFGLLDIEDWFRDDFFEDEKIEVDVEESERIVLFSHMLAIRLNNIAQKHLNNIDMKPIVVQLSENEEIKKHFKNVRFI